MLDAIQIGMTGLLGYSKGLRVIANNTANLNTPGFKSFSLQYTDLFYANSQSGSGNRTQLGYGLQTAGTRLDFRPGDLRQTGNAFDLGLDGEGLFVLRDAEGRTRYTRAGQFDFDEQGVFVNRIDGSQVMGLDAQGLPVPISLGGLRTAAGKATEVVRLTGNLSSTATQQTVGSVTVHDSLGDEHTLSIKFTNTDATAPGSWKVELLEGSKTVGEATLVFVDGEPTAESAKPGFSYTPDGRSAQSLTLDFSKDVTSFASGNLSTLAMSSQDGYAPGNLNQASFDARGRLKLAYTNGQTVEGPRLLLARFESVESVLDLGGNQYAAAEGGRWQLGTAGDGGFGAVSAGVVEMSNVDLSREFSDLVILQRGYQASSQIVSSANEMLAELFRLAGK